MKKYKILITYYFVFTNTVSCSLVLTLRLVPYSFISLEQNIFHLCKFKITLKLIVH